MECRRSIRNLATVPEDEKVAFVEAVLDLKQAPSLIPAAATAVSAGGGTPNRYDDYVWMHSQIGGGGHGGPAFGPWHREFLRQFELDLRQVSGDPDMTVPYWDWTVDNAPTTPGWPFTGTFMGGFGTAAPASFEVPAGSGPFSDPATWRINIRQDGIIRLKRNRGIPDPAQLPTRTTVTNGLPIGAYDAAPFNENPQTLTLAQVQASWRKYLEYLLHNGIHVWIGGATPTFSDGGHMTFPPVAVNDPAFWLHHSNVDRLWAIWQQRNGLGYVPQAGANAGHNGPDTMALFNNPAHFAFPLAPRPNDVLDWHARGTWYASDLPVITPRALSANFGNVPENLTTHRPIQFDVRTCQRVRFRITAISAGNFSIPPGQGTVVVEHSPTVDPVLANVYVAFQSAGALGTAQAGTATIEALIDDADGYFAAAVGGEHRVGSWTVNLTATPVARPRSAIAFVLDRSGSMSESAGPAGTKEALLKSSLQVVADIMQPNDAIGLVSYDDAVATLAPITAMGPVTPPGPGRAAVAAAIAGPDLTPRGLTAIGAGMIQGAQVLDAERTNLGTPYARFAMIVMTDGNENVPPNANSSAVATAVGGFSDSVYAIGLGSHTNVSTPTLGAIANYMLITGDITTAEQRFRLTKYFVQILASVTRTAIVVDPQGDLHLGVVHRIPFQLTEGDVSVDVIALSPAAPLLDFRLEAPDGTVITPGSGSPNVSFNVARDDAYYRIDLPAVPGSAGTHEGQWAALLSVRRGPLTHEFDLPGLKAVLGQTGTLPYSVVVQSYSNLMMHADATPTVVAPGAPVTLVASLSEYGVPVAGRATVQVEALDPLGAVTPLALPETAAGTFQAPYASALRGVHTFRFRASGITLGGRPFTREETRTAAVFVPRVGVPGGGRDDDRGRVCELLECLLKRGGLARFLERNKIDPEAVARCLRRYCRGARKETEE